MNLTDFEKDILTKYSNGWAIKEIAESKNLRRHDVEVAFRVLRHEYQCLNTVHLVCMAMRLGQIS